MKLAVFFALFLFSTYAPSSYAEKDIEMNSNYELIEIALTQSKTTKSGLKITYINHGMKSYQPFAGSQKISAPASSLDTYKLRLSFGSASKDIELSHGIGMVGDDSEEFHGFEISYVEERQEKGKSSILLNVKKK